MLSIKELQQHRDRLQKELALLDELLKLHGSNGKKGGGEKAKKKRDMDIGFGDFLAEIVSKRKTGIVAKAIAETVTAKEPAYLNNDPRKFFSKVCSSLIYQVHRGTIKRRKKDGVWVYFPK